MKQKCEEILRKLTGKKYIFFTDRANSAIKLATFYAAQNGYTKFYMPDQGGWLTYPKYAKQAKMEMFKIETELAFISPEKLNIEKKTAVIINSMAAYIALLDMDKITKKLSINFVINDASGSIGTESARYGDIILGSFGDWKPIDVKYGGFMATDDPKFAQFFSENFTKEVKDFYDLLYQKLNTLNSRLKFLDKVRAGVLSDLKNYDIVHKDKKGLDVIVKFKDEAEKKKLINYCDEKKLEHTICPRDIRVLCDAVSIEIKRLEGDS